VDIQTAYEIVNAQSPPDFGKFYGQAENIDIGAGIILDNVSYPAYHEHDKRYKLVRGFACVLSHECDIDQSNIRFFNNLLLIAPIIKFDQFSEEFSERSGPEQLRSFLDSLSKRNISRIVYVPTIANKLPWGGIIYLNQITHTHIDSIGSKSAAERICSLSAFGLQHLDQMLQRHLFREKAQRLAFSHHQ
jgi:hypothetical protein